MNEAHALPPLYPCPEADKGIRNPHRLWPARTAKPLSPPGPLRARRQQDSRNIPTVTTFRYLPVHACQGRRLGLRQRAVPDMTAYGLTYGAS